MTKKRTKCSQIHPVVVLTCTLLIFLSPMANTVFAKQFNWGMDSRLDIDTQIKYDAAWRVEDPDPALDASGNGNFDKNDMINNKFSSTIDIDLHYKQAGIFLRPRFYYDFVYDEDKFPEETKDLHRDKAEILDAFAYVDFEWGNTFGTFRLGRQVVNWGESLFITNSIGTAQNPIDVTAATSPDVQLKEVFLPTTQVMTKIDLGGNFSVAGYYQFEWEKTRLSERGAYWSTTDLLDDAGYLPVAPGITLPQGAVNEPDDEGQFGLAMRYLAEDLNYTEFGLYYINYHNKTPNLIFGYDWLAPPDPTTVLPRYHRSYAEDIKLYGFSFSSAVGNWNVSGEASYREDYPVAVESTDPVLAASNMFTYAEKDILQCQVSFMRIGLWNTLPFWENLTLTGEVGFNQVMDDDDVTLLNDDFAWGFVMQLQPEYANVFLPSLDLKIPITYTGNPDGDSSIDGTFTENADSLGVRFNFTYLAVYQFSLGYTNYFGGTDDNDTDDRDNISVSLKYTF